MTGLSNHGGPQQPLEAGLGAAIVLATADGVGTAAIMQRTHQEQDRRLAVAGALRGRRWIQSTSTCRGPELLIPWTQDWRRVKRKRVAQLHRLGVGSSADLGFEEIWMARDEAGERAQDLT